MTETVRDRLWVGALALARRQRSFDVGDVLELADVDQCHHDAVTAVLETMAEYGFLQTETSDGTWRAGSAVPLTDPNPTGFDGQFTYLNAPHSRWTFEPPVVRAWIETHLKGRVLNLFAGSTELTHDGTIVRNDIDRTVDATMHVDATEIGVHVESESFETVILDPPTVTVTATAEPEQTATPTMDPEARTRIDNQVAEIVTVGGTVITVGRSSSGLGSTRGFEKRELCLINHPGSFADTIVVVEERID